MKKTYYLCVEWYNGPSSLYKVSVPADTTPTEIVNWLAEYLEENEDFDEDRDSIMMLGEPEDITVLEMSEI